jgi:hypothetical protein
MMPACTVTSNAEVGSSRRDGVWTAAVHRRTAAVQVGRSCYFFPPLLFLLFFDFLLFSATRITPLPDSDKSTTC